MRGCNLKWSVYSSIEGLVSREGLLHIRRGLSSHYTWIFKDKLGLFHLKSQRSRSRPPYPCSCLTALSPNPDLSHLIALLLLPSPHLFILSRYSFLHLQIRFFHHVSRLPVIYSFCGSSELRGRWGRWRDEHLSFPPLVLSCPASTLPVRGGDWDAVDYAAAGSSFALITPREPTMVWFGFLQSGLIFHISDVNGPWNPPPHTFDQICTICLWWEMNRLAGVLLFNSPSWCK